MRCPRTSRKPSIFGSRLPLAFPRRQPAGAIVDGGNPRCNSKGALIAPPGDEQPRNRTAVPWATRGAYEPPGLEAPALASLCHQGSEVRSAQGLELREDPHVQGLALDPSHGRVWVSEHGRPPAGDVAQLWWEPARTIGWPGGQPINGSPRVFRVRRSLRAQSSNQDWWIHGGLDPRLPASGLAIGPWRSGYPGMEWPIFCSHVGWVSRDVAQDQTCQGRWNGGVLQETQFQSGRGSGMLASGAPMAISTCSPHSPDKTGQCTALDAGLCPAALWQPMRWRWPWRCWRRIVYSRPLGNCLAAT